MFIRIKGQELELVSTDGHRLAYDKCDRRGDAIDDLHLLIPARAAKILEQLLPDEGNLLEVRSAEESVEFCIPPYSTGSRVRREFPATTITSRLIDLKYPDVQRVLPKRFEAWIDVDRERLTAALRRVLLVCRQKDQNPVAFYESKGGQLSIKADAGASNQIEEKLDCQGGDIKAALNPQYVLEVLNVLDGERISINWISEVNPVTITCDKHPDFKYVVMPIRMD